MRDRPKSVVLLSGGMDSTYAAIWAMEHTMVQVFLWIDYGQKGAPHEQEAVFKILHHIWNAYPERYPIGRYIRISLPDIRSSLLAVSGPRDLTPGLVDNHGNPQTFVPARNLIMLSLAANMAYSVDAYAIVGGWSSVDVDYPDCRGRFLVAAEQAINFSLGYKAGTLMIKAPVLNMSKSQMIASSEWGDTGAGLNVPWELTRSCYGDKPEPCGKCDSCLVRARAFLANNLKDPIYSNEEWAKLLEREKEHECKCTQGSG